MIDYKNLAKSIENTFKKRQTNFDIDYFKETIGLIESSSILKNGFNDYKEKMNYVKNVDYEDTVLAIREIISILEKELIEV